MLRYAKTGVAVLVPVAIALNSWLNGAGANQKEIEDIALAILGAIGVFAVPNRQPT